MLTRSREFDRGPYDLAVVNFRTALEEVTDLKSTLSFLHACQSLAHHAETPILRGVSIDPTYLWELRGLSFEGEVAALRRGGGEIAEQFRGARLSYEELLASHDPEQNPQIRSLRSFVIRHGLPR